MKYWTHESTDSVKQLRKKLDNFYQSSNNGYSAFESISSQNIYWDIVIDKIRIKLKNQNKLEILEFGAGKTGFPLALDDLRKFVNFTAQDVTNLNLEHLTKVSDNVYIGDINKISGSFDIIFSTFVWEHITNPQETLDSLLKHLKPNGSLFIFSPRYDWPGYIPPALRHLKLWKAMYLSFRLVSRRLFPLQFQHNSFLIVLDPAVFHAKKWFRDSDAIHLVSRHDIKNYLTNKNTIWHDCYPKKTSYKAKIMERLMKLCIEIIKKQ